ncbi:UNVERIFIED_CONTAM: hypothetical protein Sradi_4898100 [Sesamum radiatum]|uniref:Uncharacterized protein n=1 Tax=Sesamum radiatum TaxID=300843 RepID=A0AAW2MC74_SESRA
MVEESMGSLGIDSRCLDIRVTAGREEERSTTKLLATSWKEKDKTTFCTFLLVHHERYRASACGAINEEGRRKWILPKNRKRSAMPGRGDGKRNGSEEINWGSQCFSTLNEMRQPRDALLLTPQGSETELNLSLG